MCLRRSLFRWTVSCGNWTMCWWVRIIWIRRRRSSMSRWIFLWMRTCLGSWGRKHCWILWIKLLDIETARTCTCTVYCMIYTSTVRRNNKSIYFIASLAAYWELWIAKRSNFIHGDGSLLARLWEYNKYMLCWTLILLYMLFLLFRNLLFNFAKDLPRLLQNKRNMKWEHYVYGI